MQIYCHCTVDCHTITRTKHSIIDGWDDGDAAAADDDDGCLTWLLHVINCCHCNGLMLSLLPVHHMWADWMGKPWMRCYRPWRPGEV